MAVHFNPRGGFENILTNYNAIAAWSSENVLVDGTTTTVYDWMGNHDLTNPSAITQPTLNTASAYFPGKPDIYFDGIGGSTEYVSKNIAIYNPGFCEIHSLMYGPSPRVLIAFSSADVASNVRYFDGPAGISSNDYGRVYYTTTLNRVNDTLFTVRNDNRVHSTTFGSNGSRYIIAMDGLTTQVTGSSGDNNGTWIGSVNLRDNIAIGASLRFTPQYATQYWATTIITPVLTNKQRSDLHYAIKYHFNVL
jgi:hypothetical protein